eukprot:SAG22_NODE_10648_length_523_cov_0.974057_1_plen_174_part_11
MYSFPGWYAMAKQAHSARANSFQIELLDNHHEQIENQIVPPPLLEVNALVPGLRLDAYIHHGRWRLCTVKKVCGEAAQYCRSILGGDNPGTVTAPRYSGLSAETWFPENVVERAELGEVVVVQFDHWTLGNLCPVPLAQLRAVRDTFTPEGGEGVLDIALSLNLGVFDESGRPH